MIKKKIEELSQFEVEYICNEYRLRAFHCCDKKCPLYTEGAFCKSDLYIPHIKKKYGKEVIEFNEEKD